MSGMAYSNRRSRSGDVVFDMLFNESAITSEDSEVAPSLLDKVPQYGGVISSSDVSHNGGGPSDSDSGSPVLWVSVRLFSC